MSTLAKELVDLDKISEIALALTRDERAQLLEAIQYSLLTNTEKAEHDAWIEELKRRVAEVESGKVETIDGDQVMSEARARLQAVRDSRSID